MLRLAILLLAVSSALAAIAQEPANPPDRPVDKALLKRIAQQVEPSFKGSQDRLAHYIEHFQHKVCNDPRLFAFDVNAHAEGKRGVSLHGFVEFPETRNALVEYFKALGFEPVENKVGTLPAKDLGKRKFGFIKAAHSLSYAEPAEEEVVTDCLLGEPVFLLRSEDDHFLIHGGDGYLGYVAADDVEQVDEAGFSEYLKGPRVCVHRDQKIDGALIPAGSRLKWISTDGDKIVGALPTGEEITLPAAEVDLRRYR